MIPPVSESYLIFIYIYLLYLSQLRQKGPAYMETDVGLQIKLEKNIYYKNINMTREGNGKVKIGQNGKEL